MPGLLDFTDKTILVTGAATGIGAAAAEQFIAHGAIVHSLDIAPVSTDVASEITCDLGDPSSINAAIAELPDRIDGLINCAGVPNGGRFSGEQVMRINWLGLRCLTEAMLPRIPEGGSVVHVASTAGRGWPAHLTEMTELMGAGSFDEGLACVADHEDVIGDGYALSKEAVQYYTMWRSLQTLPNGVRINSVCPGVTNTALADDFRRGVGPEVLDRAAQIAGRMAEPGEMAPALLFLADDASASYINGTNLNVDRGTGAAHLTGSF